MLRLTTLAIELAAFDISLVTLQAHTETLKIFPPELIHGSS